MINLQLSRRLFVDKFYPYLYDYSHRWECYMGSAGSSKSYFITQKLILRALNEKIKILVCRRYGSTIRNSCFSLFKEILNKWKINRPDIIKINESDMRIRFVMNDSEIIFLGLDDENKLLSINDIGTVFVEEAYECSKDIVEQLNLRMRGHNENQQIIMAWNPINKNHWLYDFCEVNPPESFLYLHSTYRDNPFLSAEYVKSLEELYIRNVQKARIFCDGEWGVDTDGLVFSNWTVEDFDINSIAKTCEHRCGIDWGYNDPSAIADTFYDKNNKVIYVANEFYRTGQTLDELYLAIVMMGLNKVKIQADSAEPRTIEYFRKRYLNVVPCVKGQGSVEARIMFLQNHRIIVSPKCKSIINELENFSYIKDKKTGKFTDSMTHEFSHAIDAIGYAYSDIYTNNKLRTVDKSVLGL